MLSGPAGREFVLERCLGHLLELLLRLIGCLQLLAWLGFGITKVSRFAPVAGIIPSLSCDFLEYSFRVYLSS